jgi:hypothetical protein
MRACLDTRRVRGLTLESNFATQLTEHRTVPYRTIRKMIYNPRSISILGLVTKHPAARGMLISHLIKPYLTRTVYSRKISVGAS